MRRAVVFVTLAMLLLAVAGVTAAQEGAFQNDGSTATPPEATSFEATEPESTSPEATGPDTDAPEGTTPETVKPEAPEPEQTNESERPDEGEESGEKPEANGIDEPEDKGKKKGEGEPDDSSIEKANDEAGGGQKVLLCHKGKATISVGAPAQRAHLRHGDALGACDSGSAGSEGVAEARDEPKGPGGGPPDGKGRPEGVGKPDDAGRKPGGLQWRGNGAR